MKQLTIGSTEQESITITVFGYERSPVGEFYDDNWLRCEVSVRAGAFGGEFPASFLTSELEALRQGLAQLHDTLQGGYDFESMERQLMFRVSCDRLGGIGISGEAMDRPGDGNRLGFGFSMDQTYLAKTLSGLSEVMQAFPVRG